MRVRQLRLQLRLPLRQLRLRLPLRPFPMPRRVQT
jgi:hypothetical protein